MATKTFEELKQLAIQIRDEKTNKQNTATRIGTQMLEHLNKLEQDYYDKTATDEELKQRDEKLTELSSRSVLDKSIMCYGETNPCFIIDMEEGSVTVGKGLKMYSIDGRYAQTVTTESHAWWNKTISLPNTTSYWYHLLVKDDDMVIVTSYDELNGKLNDGYYYVCTIRRSLSNDSQHFVNGNINVYEYNGELVYKDTPFNRAFDNAFNGAFDSASNDALDSALNPYFSSKRIKIEKNVADKSEATFRNGIFDITLIRQYAGLNFLVEKDDSDVYYVINIKSTKYTTWDDSAPNHITYGARKYNGDANTPSGLNIVSTITKVKNDGSLTLGVRIQNPSSLEDTVFRVMFWGEPDTIHISSIKTYDSWEFDKCLNDSIGITAKTSQFAKSADTAFNGTKFQTITAGTQISVQTLNGLSLKDGEYKGSVETSTAGNYLSLKGTFESNTYFFAVAILNSTELYSNVFLRCTYNFNINYSKTLYSNTRIVNGKVVLITVVSTREYNGNTYNPDTVYFRVNEGTEVNLDCEAIMGFSSGNNNFEEIFEYICNNINTIKLNVPTLNLETFIADKAVKSYTAFNGDKYEEITYPAVINGVTKIGNYNLINGEYSLDAVIENVRGYGNTYMEISLPEEYSYYIGVAVLDSNYNPEDQPIFRLTGKDTNYVTTYLDEVYQVGEKYVRIIIVSAKSYNGDIIYPNRMYFFGSEDKVFKFHIYDFKAWAINNITDDDFTSLVDSIITYVKKGQILSFSNFSSGVLTADKIKGINNILDDIIKKLNIPPVPGIVCWGSSSTAGGGWVNKLSELTGMKTYNGGVGGENLWTILGRIGSDPMRLKQSITIPADATPIQLGTVAAWGGGSIFEVRGHKVTPLLQGDGLINPVIIDGIEGTIKWNGSRYDDPNGYYTFTRSVAGEERTTLPDEIIFSYGSRTMRNCIQILLLGYNQGYSSTEEYVEMVKRAKEFAYNGMCLIVGRHAATDKEAADKIIAEEVEFKKEFGMMFVSSREYMILHGLQEAGIEPTAEDEEDIANGIVPRSLRVDTAHFNTAGYSIFLNLIYRRGKELGYFAP